MTGSDRRRRLADALSVTWTFDLGTRTKTRIDDGLIARRRRRRRALTASALFATVFTGGLVFAFVRGLGERAPERLPPRAIPVSVPSLGASSSSSVPPLSPTPPPSPEHRPRTRRTLPAVVRAHATPSAKAEDPIETRFALADRARLAGRPTDALRPLTEIQDLCPADPRAAIAAFQLGRIFADELGDPASAARAFDRARALAPFGPLAHDARARAEHARREAARTTPALAR
jgi:hypothetical protein